ncbi:hypothetical protein MLD38_007060 [Melastoma candidum]|uniref:Uncharacterized protein n=1 Tax=Melastoma candidum TaxID=119954 RepID=A0ACB9RR47_9MYRT|nr:hypothetical protein MLD38_007060 [Melastoma candidum]
MRSLILTSSKESIPNSNPIPSPSCIQSRAVYYYLGPRFVPGSCEWVGSTATAPLTLDPRFYMSLRR